MLRSRCNTTEETVGKGSVRWKSSFHGESNNLISEPQRWISTAKSSTGVLSPRFGFNAPVGQVHFYFFVRHSTHAVYWDSCCLLHKYS